MTNQNLDEVMFGKEYLTIKKSVPLVNLDNVKRIMTSGVKGADKTREKLYIMDDGRVETNPAVYCHTDMNLEAYLFSIYGHIPSSKSIPFVYLDDVKRMFTSEFPNANGTYDHIYVLKSGQSELNPIVTSSKKNPRLKKNYNLLRYVSTELDDIVEQFDAYSSTSQGDFMLIRNAVLFDFKEYGIKPSSYRWSKHRDVVKGLCFMNMDFYHSTHFYRSTKMFADETYAAENVGNKDA